MERFWKVTIAVGIIFGFSCLSYMFVYSATKSIVITEEHDLQGEANLEPLAQSILEEKEQYDFVVLVNSAHGGENKGNMVNDLPEKEITLAVGGYLEEMSQEGDVGIFMIRQEDINVSNEARADLIASVEPDMVVDLHVGADPVNERTLGVSIFYNAWFYTPGLTNVELADILERNLVTEISGKANGVFKDTQGRYPLLEMIQVPAASVEMGYLTNKEEAALLKKEDYQKKLAEGLYKGILAAREEMSKS